MENTIIDMPVIPLEHCPFCNAPAIEHSVNGYEWVECSHCHASTEMYYKGIDAHINAWNRRAR